MRKPRAYDYLHTLLAQAEMDFTEVNVLALHHWVVFELDEALPGRYRNRPVIITGSEFIPPAPGEVPGRMAELFTRELPDWRKNRHPIEAAALAHWKLVNIHPFMDGNGRTARLLMNLLLMRAGYGPTIIAPILRADYIAALDAAHRTGDCQPFIHFISHCVHESLKDLLRLVKALSQ